MSRHGVSIPTVLPDKERIPRKIKISENFRTFDKNKKDYSRTRQKK